MAATTKFGADEVRRTTLSPRPKGRENSKKDTLCRNITIYGHCRYEDKGCLFNHDPAKAQSSPVMADRYVLLSSSQERRPVVDVPLRPGSSRKHLNVDSPAFTPAALSTPPSVSLNTIKKTTAISPKAASAAPFQPKSTASGAVTPVGKSTPSTPSWARDVPEFLPQQNYDSLHVTNGVNSLAATNALDSFPPPSPFSTTSPLNHQPPTNLNPYVQDPVSIPTPTFYSSQTSYQLPPQYHLYSPWGPYEERLAPFQKPIRDFFIQDKLREDIQKRNAAALQVLPNSSLPRIEPFNTFVPLDTNNARNATLFGFPSWIYKAISEKDGKIYAVRRIEGFRMTNEKAIYPMKTWKKIINASIVTVHEAFTTRAFGDSSLLFVTDYHPLSKTLAEAHFRPYARFQGGRILNSTNVHVPESVLWAYLVQLTNALKAIHVNGLAARIIDPSKILLTDKNRIRLNACAILDVVQYETQPKLQDLQQRDFLLLGRLIQGIGINNTNVGPNFQLAQDQFSRFYSQTLNSTVLWLMNESQSKDIHQLSSIVSEHMMDAFDSTLHLNDQLHSELSREVENGRVMRLLTKLGFINERPEFDQDPRWSEYGKRYFLKLFRDYVFHQIDTNRSPVVDLGHVISCLNKLDAGSDEKVHLVSRDEQTSIVVTYKELKAEIDKSFQDLGKVNHGSH